MAMDTNLPKASVEQEEAYETVREYAKGFKDVAYTDPVGGKTGFTAQTLDGNFIVSFGYDDENPTMPGWYYSVSAAQDYAHSASGSGMSSPGQAEHLISKVISGRTWYAEHDKQKAERKHEEALAADGVISTQKEPNGDYEVISD